MEHKTLTQLQKLYWTGQQLRSSSAPFVTGIIFHIHGLVDERRFYAALSQVHCHVDSLRSVVCEEQGVPGQMVVENLPLPYQFRDFSTEVQPLDAAGEWCVQQLNACFDLSARLYETALLKVGQAQYYWFLNLHHINADARSCFLLFDLVEETYRIAGNDPRFLTMPPAVVPFVDYLAYEAAYSHSRQYEKDKAYWQKRLRKEVNPLSFWGKRVHQPGLAVTREHLVLGEVDSKQLKGLLAREGTPPLTADLALHDVLVTLFFAHLYQITNQKHLSFISPIHNRPTKSLRSTVGLLMEMCPYVVEIDSQETFFTLLQKVQKQSLAIMRHYRFGTHIQLKNLVHNVMFNVHHRPHLTFDGMAVTHRMPFSGQGTYHYALTVHEHAQPTELRLKFDFNEDIFDPSDRRRTVSVFETLLREMLADVHQSLDRFALPVMQDLDRDFITAPCRTTPYESPRDLLELKLQKIWQRVLGFERIGIRDNYFELGGTSWQSMQLFNEIEKEIGHYLPLSALVQQGTIAELAEVLRSKQGKDNWPVLVTLQAGEGGKRPLFCVHGGGGHVLIYVKLVRHLGFAQPVHAFQAQGLDGRETPLRNVHDMARKYIAAMREVQPQGPYCITGYSMGGAIAFEMARLLHHQGQKVDLLFIIDVAIPGPKMKILRNLTKKAAKLFRWPEQKEGEIYISLRRRFWLSLRENGQWLWSKLARRSNQLPQKEVQTMADDMRIRRIQIINNRAFDLYIPDPYPGTIQLMKSIGGYGNIYRDSDDPQMGWRHWAAAVQTHTITGNHNSMMEEPHVRELARIMREKLESLRSSDGDFSMPGERKAVVF